MYSVDMFLFRYDVMGKNVGMALKGKHACCHPQFHRSRNSALGNIQYIFAYDKLSINDYYLVI